MTLPTAILAGDTHKFTYGHASYPVSDGWTCTYLLVGESSRLSLSGVSNGTDFDFTVSATQSGLLKAGTYSYTARMSLGGEVYTTAAGNVVVQEDLATTTAKIVHAEKMLALIEKALQGRFTDADGIEAGSIGGRNFALMKVTELEALRARYYRELKTLRGELQNPSGVRTISVQVGRFR